MWIKTGSISPGSIKNVITGSISPKWTEIINRKPDTVQIQCTIFSSYITFLDCISCASCSLFSEQVLLSESHGVGFEAAENGTATAFCSGLISWALPHWRNPTKQAGMCVSCQIDTNVWQERLGKHRGIHHNSRSHTLPLGLQTVAWRSHLAHDKFLSNLGNFLFVTAFANI